MKKNPADLTKRNNDARKKDIAKLRELVKQLKPTQRMVVDLAERQRKYEATVDTWRQRVDALLVTYFGNYAKRMQ